MNINTDTTAARVEAARIAAERPMKWVADKSGIAYPTYLRKVHGGGDFTVGEVGRIARAIGVPPIDLLPDEFHEQRYAEKVPA